MTTSTLSKLNPATWQARSESLTSLSKQAFVNGEKWVDTIDSLAFISQSQNLIQFTRKFLNHCPSNLEECQMSFSPCHWSSLLVIVVLVYVAQYASNS